MEDGTYLASRDTFVGRRSGATYKTRVFRSTDRGRSWAHVSTIDDLAFATLFSNVGLNRSMVKHSVPAGNRFS
jgi:hypothetical protein